jgi:two-component system, response regulator / RNA-binding antiterminator
MQLAKTEKYMSPRWRVLLATLRQDRARVVEEALAPTSHRLVGVVSLSEDLAVNVERAQPDLLVLDIGEPMSGMLGRIRQLMDAHPLPIVVFADRSNNDEVRASVKAGVASYVVDGLKSERVISVLEAAMTRFVEFEGLKVQRDEAVAKLAERRDIERAKGILMRRRDLGEQAAYDTLRKMAMDRGVRMVEVAKSILAAEELLARN